MRAAFVVAALGVVAGSALAGCSKSLDQLSPFPCALDGSCPEGFVCETEKCVVANVDELGCTTDGVDCKQQLTCFDDACEPPCQTDAACGGGRLCAPPIGSAGSGSPSGCEIDCTDGTACPSGFTCTPRFTDTSKICVPDGTTFIACESTSNVTSCLTQQCGTPGDYTVPCGGSDPVCAFNEACNAGSALPCECPITLTLCDGTPQGSGNECVTAANGYPQCMCLLPSDLMPTCTSNHFQSQGNCDCLDGTSISYSCGDTRTCEAICEAGS